jgi:hypothetical protein
MKKSAFLFLLAMIGFACTDSIKKTARNQKKPDKLISIDTMTAIMTELQLVEASVGLAPLNYALQVARYKKYEGEIFKKYATDSANYFDNYAYYAQDAKLLKKMYLTIFDTIMMRKASIDTLIKKTNGAIPVPLPTMHEGAMIR